MYQDCIPVNSVQTVRAANESHGVEVVTQQKVIILVASNAEDQHKWIRAIYEAMKDKRPRSHSSPEHRTDNESKANRKRSSTGPKISIGRIFSGFNRRSTDEMSQEQGQSKFYLEPQQPAHAEIGVQANIPRTRECQRVEEREEEGEDLTDDVFETDVTAVDTSQKQELDAQMSMLLTELEHRSPLGSNPLPDNSQDTGDNVPSTHISEAVLDTGTDLKEDGMRELESMLQTFLSASEDGHDNTDQELGRDVHDYSEDDEEGPLTSKTRSEKSAFEELETLLRTT
ncbi:uncharacterized protein LOC110980240 isoform X2 [Acanthaster planci]|nr:uncharacterized protein LOC110980240 isoform X2 [Acanthaster planci]